MLPSCRFDKLNRGGEFGSNSNGGTIIQHFQRCSLRVETVLPTCPLIGKQDDVSYNVGGDINAIRAKGMGNRYPSNSVIRVAKQLLVNWKTANGAWSSDYQPVIGLVINSRSIFHRSICWPIRLGRSVLRGRRIFELLVRRKSNFQIQQISRDWKSTSRPNFAPFVAREGGRGRKIRIVPEGSEGDVGGRSGGRERERERDLIR